jgi:ligand-binding sensor domain-containing protein/signal transduction histidine kinase
MHPPESSDLTQMLVGLELGEKRAEERLPLVYNELRRLAAVRLAQERPGQTLQATALVHEAWLRLIGTDRQQWNGRDHFFRAAAQAMRRILVENARRKSRLKHGGHLQRVCLLVLVQASFLFGVLSLQGGQNCTPAVEPRAVRFAAPISLDGDNRPDLIVAHRQSAELQVLLGVGDVTFRGPVTLEVRRGVRSIAIADLSHDGLPDLAAANPFDQTVSVYLNTTGTSTADSPDLFPEVAAPRNRRLEVIDAKPLTAGNSLGDYHAEIWTTDRGLPQNTIQCLLQSRNGYLWVGTPSGLARFDGLRFASFDRNNTPALNSDDILCLAQGVDDILWIGTSDGLVRFKEHRFKRFTTTELIPGLPTQQVFAVCPEPAGGVWLGANGLLAHLQDGRFTVVTNLGSRICSILQDQAGCLWVGTAQAVLRREAETNEWSPVYLSEFSPGGFDKSVYQERSGSLWFGNEVGLWRYEKGQHSVYRAKQGLSGGLVKGFAQDPSGDIWVVAGHRLHRLRDGRFSRVGVEAGLPDDGVSCVWPDREGNIWVGTSRSGLVRLHPCQFVTYNSRDGLADDKVVSISASPDGILWFATDAGLSRFSNEKFSTLTAPPSPDIVEWNALRSVLADGSGEVWAGGQALFTVKGERLECWEPRAQRFFRFVDSLYRDSAGALWATTESGLWRLKGTERDLYTVPGWTNIFNDGARPGELAGCTVHTNAPPWPRPLGVLEDRQGNLWIGSKGAGLHCFHNGQFTSFTTANGLTSEYAGPLKADPDGTLWVGSDRGLNRLKDGCITRYTTAEGLAENIVGNLLEDDQGWLWTMGHRGLHRMLKQELIEFAEGKRSGITAISYGTADGMLSAEANVGYFPNACQTADGLLWFPTTRGVLVVEPHLLETRDVPPPVVLEQVLADGEIIYGDGARPAVKAHLAPGRARLLEFHYTASLFHAPEQVRFKYKLEGHDSQWGEAGTRRTAVYTDVAPGKYRFRVLALSPQGLESENPAEFAFSLAPHLYQTRWFYALTALGAVLSVGSLHRLRVVRLARRQQLEHELELALERERIAKDMHDDLGASLTQIGLLSEHARRNTTDPPAVAADIEKIATATRQTAQAAEEMVWVMSQRHDTLESLATYLCQLAREYLEPSGIRCRLDVPAQLPDVRVPSETRHNIVLFVKEALNNTVKHSAAREVWLALKVADHTLTLALLDDGCGFEMSPSSIKSHPFPNGNGLHNLRKRAEAMGGQFELRSHPGQGTCVKAIIRLVP